MIIELFFSRDEQAIRETDRKYGRLCYDIANTILKNAEDADECVNDTYVSLWNQIPPTKPQNFLAYICKITRNISIKKLQYNHAAKRDSDLLAAMTELDQILPEERLETSVHSREIGKVISTFLENEKPDARAVFIRRYWYMESVDSIAERYSFSVSKVKSILFHSRRRLKEYLKKEGIMV